MAKKKKQASKKEIKEKAEKETMRESAARLKKNLDDFLTLVESEGSQLSPEELQGFEDRQFDHITKKIADAIITRIGEKKFKTISKQLKSGKITLHEAATQTNLKMGDLFLILETRKVFSEEELRKKLSRDRKP